MNFRLRKLCLALRGEPISGGWASLSRIPISRQLHPLVSLDFRRQHDAGDPPQSSATASTIPAGIDTLLANLNTALDDMLHSETPPALMSSDSQGPDPAGRFDTNPLLLQHSTDDVAEHGQEYSPVGDQGRKAFERDAEALLHALQDVQAAIEDSKTHA